jgi:DNA-binding CsgD family transcriptional regulator
MASAVSFARARESILEICRGDVDARALRLEVLSVIRRAVGFDAYAWLLTDPETSVGSSPLADVPCLPELPQLIRLKYLTGINRWTGLPARAASLSEATGGDLSQSLLWRELLCQHQVTDLLSSVYRDQFGCWGFLDLWRIGSASPFPQSAVGFLADVARPVSTALRRSQARTFVASGPDAQVTAGPAVLLLSHALAVRAQTPPTHQYLQVLVPPDAENQPPVPAGAYNVAAQLLAVEAGVDINPALARVHLANGLWLTLRAARMGADGPAQERDIAVSVETASPHDRVSVFARASGLSAREAELLGHLTTGADTADVARRMFVSGHTVQDHLKSIFTKTGARSRRTLLARALGT